jgi:FkbM family methyltransferase
MRRAVIAALRLWIYGGGTLLLLACAVWAYPPLAMVAIATVRPYPLCEISDVHRGARQRLAWNAARDKARAESRMLSSDGKYEQWETPFGAWWIPANNWHAFPVILGQMPARYYAPENAVCRRGDVVWDAGAHVGTYAKQALADGAELVIAIEPSPRNLECLRRNLREEIRSGRVLIAPVGVWDREEKLPIYEDPDHTAADSFVEKTGAPTAVLQLTTIDKLVALYEVRVDVIKMDIKGATTRALRGAAGSIAKHKPWLQLTTEEGDVDDPGEITATVRSIRGDYAVRCGDCSMDGGRVRPNVLTYR